MIEYVYLLKRKGRERRIKMKRFALPQFNVTLRICMLAWHCQEC